MIPKLDSDGGEWTPPDEYDAVAIHSMAEAFQADPTFGHLATESAWWQTDGRYQYAFENEDAWAILGSDAPDEDWFLDMVAKLVDLPES